MTHIPVLSRIARDRSGIAAVEFALILPLMITLFIGSFELSGLLMADMKLTAAVETAADLVAQRSELQGALGSSDFTTFASAAQAVLAPVPTTPPTPAIQLAFASVTYSTATPVLDWDNEQNGATALTIATMPNSQDMTKLGTASTTDSVIVVKAQFTYTSPTATTIGWHVLSTTYNLSESAFNRPRYVPCIAYPNSPHGAEGASTTCP